MVQGATTTTYTYTPFNCLLSAGSTTYAYDANGNMVTKNDGFPWMFTYDYDNRLTKAVHGGTTVLQNFYDGDGRRIEKTEGDSTVFTFLGLNVLFEKDLNTGVVTKRFYANGLQVAKMVGSTVSYLHEDHLGSIRFVSSSAGAQVFRGNYAPYGPQYGLTGNPDEFMFAGKIYDGSTGFYYFGGRFYYPATGRFITQDSSPGVREDPQSFDRYVYARDNPLKIVDPNGHDWWSGLVSAVTSFASAATNAWNSLPPPVQTVIVVAAVSASVVATGGAAGPAILAGAALMGGANAGISVASNVASGQPINVNNALSSFSMGFALGPIAMVTEGNPTTEEIGNQGELDAQKLLANAGIETEQGWRAYPEGGGSRGVQLDLVDLKGQQFFDAKVGRRGAGYWVETVDIDHQAALLNEPVTIKNHAAGLEISGFTFRAGTWLNLKNSADVGGFVKPLKDYLGKNNMDWAYLY